MKTYIMFAGYPQETFGESNFVALDAVQKTNQRRPGSRSPGGVADYCFGIGETAPLHTMNCSSIDRTRR